MESAAVAAEPAGVAPGTKGLKGGVLGWFSNMVIGVASTAPAYSLAATLGFVVGVAGVGLHAPAVLIVSFIPMLLIAAGYNYMNKADPDAGTSFIWVTRAMGPQLGWLTGWVIVVADVIVMAALAYVAGVYTFLLFGLDAAASNLLDVSLAAGVWIALMTFICYIGIEVSARTQYFLLGLEILTLSVFAIVALTKAYADPGPASIHVAADWFNPFSMSASALVDGVLLGVFIYWGWDSGVCVNEESSDSRRGPGKAAVMSTILLLLIYVAVATSSQAYAGDKFLVHHGSDVLKALGTHVFPSPLDKLLIIAVLTSAAASTQTTILPTARTTLSMAKFGAIPRAFGRIHPRYLTPDVSTLAMGAVSLAWTLFIINVSQNVLSDSITALGFQIAFYYGLTGFACAIFYRRELFKSLRNFVYVGLAPFAGGAMLTYIFVKAFIDLKKPIANYSGDFLGIGTSVAIGVGLILVGVVVLVFVNFIYPRFFRRKLEVADPRVLTGEIAGTASAVAAD
jgi:amino acid transporter